MTRFLQIEPTTRCNMGCWFCCGREMDQSDMPWATYLSTLDALPDLEHVELHGEGEPTLHPRFVDMVAEAHRRGLSTSVITNGSTLRGLARPLVDAGIDCVMVSVDSTDPERYEAIRRWPLAKVVDGIDALVLARGHRLLPTVGLTTVVLSPDAPELPGVIDLYRRLGLDGGVNAQGLNPMAYYTARYPEAVVDQVRRLDAPVAGNRIGFYDRLFAGFRAGARRCPWLDSALYVNRHGVSTACCMVKDHARFGFGTLPSASVFEARAVMARTLARGERPEPCVGCETLEAALR